MMLHAILLSGSFLVTHAPGWSPPMITVDMWSYMGGQYKTIQCIGQDTLHQSWNDFNQETRVGYKVYDVDGTVIYPETMISNNVWSATVNSAIVSIDSIAFIWREGSPAYYTVRKYDGSEAIPTSLYLSEPWVNYPQVHSSSDSLGRLHSVFTLWDGYESRIGYMVFEPGVGEIWRDTIPGSHTHPRILVDGSRVHIVFRGEDLWPDYIQYDLDHNITVPTVSLIEDLTYFYTRYDLAIDNEGNLYCFFILSQGNMHLSLFKIDGSTGEILIDDKIILQFPNLTSQSILTGPSGDSLYLMWIGVMAGGSPRYVMFAVIDKNGEFIEEPYAAYDYTDEKIQQIQALEATANDNGDVFAIWSQGDVTVGGYWIVMGWFDHEYLGIEEESVTPVSSADLTIRTSSNPFSEGVGITITAGPLPDHLEVYDLSGRIVRTLYSTGDGMFFWDGCDSDDNELPSGSYIIRGSSGDSSGVLSVIKL
jgi:hypothetical protein